MRFGAIIATVGELAAVPGVTEQAKAAEAAGADTVWVSDHLMMLRRDITDYPYEEDGSPSWPRFADYYEAMTVCSMMAAVTTRVRIGTGVLVLPQRNVIEVAKVAASLDRLSGGRLSLGVGAGWYEDEMRALGWNYRTRGKRFNDMLQILKSCWSGNPEAFQGEELSIAGDLILLPTPVKPEGPPLLVGGNSALARRRAARYGDGWMSLAFADKLDIGQLSEWHESVCELRRELHGDDSLFQTVLKFHLSTVGWDELPDMMVELAKIGFDEIAFEPRWSEDLSDAMASINEVRSAVEGAAV
jgi:probable F420-dependent oxidoreductase